MHDRVNAVKEKVVGLSLMINTAQRVAKFTVNNIERPARARLEQNVRSLVKVIEYGLHPDSGAVLIKCELMGPDLEMHQHLARAIARAMGPNVRVLHSTNGNRLDKYAERQMRALSQKRVLTAR